MRELQLVNTSNGFPEHTETCVLQKLLQLAIRSMADLCS